MAKLSDAELTAITQDELEKLVEEVKQRTKSTITGVKIPDLTEAQAIDGTEMLIIEGKNGTQRTSMNNLPIAELVDARDGHQQLKDRLDEMKDSIQANEQGIQGNKQDITNLTNNYDSLNKEVVNARDNGVTGAKYTTLKERLDSDFSHLNSEIEKTNTQLSRIQIDVSEHGVDINSTEPQQDEINEILDKYQGHTIYFPDGNYFVDNSLIVKSNTTLKFSNNAWIIFKENSLTTSVNQNDYAGSHIVKNHDTDGQSNIKIFGLKIDGKGYTQARDAHRGLRIENLDGFELKNCIFKEVSGWSVQYVNLSNFLIENIEIDACQESIHGFNGDGISGAGQHGIIRNISGYASDDLVSTHAGEDILDVNCTVENILIENVTAKSKNGDKCYRAFAIYDNGTSSTKNVTIDGVYGVTSVKPRIRNFTRSSGNGNMSNIRLSNIHLVNTSLEVRDVNIDTLEMDNVHFSDLDGDQIVNFIAVTNNATLKYLILEDVKCNLVKGSHFFINDHVGIENIFFDRCYFNNDANASTYIYYRNNINSTAETNLIPQSVLGNVPFIGGKASNSQGVIKVISTQTSNFNGRLTYRDSDLIFDKDLGYKFYDAQRNKWLSLSQFHRFVCPAPRHFNDNQPDLVDIAYPQSVLSVGDRTKDITLNFSGDNLWSGITFYVSVNTDQPYLSFTRNGTQLFGGAKLSKGFYVIINLNENWVVSKISDEPAKSTL